MKKEKTYTFKEFKEFLATNCWSEKEYGDGKYDLKIYRWFDLGKPHPYIKMKKKSKVAK